MMVLEFLSDLFELYLFLLSVGILGGSASFCIRRDDTPWWGRFLER